MNNTNYINLSRQVTLVRELEVLSNNVANLNTVGFKSERMDFKEYVQLLTEGQGRLSFVQTRNISRTPETGAIKVTQAPLDLAISKEGYFQIDTDKGLRYTRDGRFQLNEEGLMVTQHGFPVLDVDGQAIDIPPEAFEGTNGVSLAISSDGTIKQGQNVIAQVAIVNVGNEEALTKVGNNLYIDTLEQEQISVQSGLMQGALEGSNVNAILEMTKLIETHRQFEAVDGFIKREDERQRARVKSLISQSA